MLPVSATLSEDSESSGPRARAGCDSEHFIFCLASSGWPTFLKNAFWLLLLFLFLFVLKLCLLSLLIFWMLDFVFVGNFVVLSLPCPLTTNDSPKIRFRFPLRLGERGTSLPVGCFPSSWLVVPSSALVFSSSGMDAGFLNQLFFSRIFFFLLALMLKCARGWRDCHLGFVTSQLSLSFHIRLNYS